MNSNRIAIISDIHANNDVLEDVLQQIGSMSVDLTVVLGDLLTYGCQPNEVLDNLSEYSNKNKCIFIKGNHDQFYFDLKAKKNNFQYDLPDFVEESIYWTDQKIGNVDLQSMFDWKEEFTLDPVYFSHANPFGHGNWEYVESPEQYCRACSELTVKGSKVGVFGHSHRSKLLNISAANEQLNIEKREIELSDDSFLILNPGSVGQPRGSGLSYMIMNMKGNVIRADLKAVETDLSNSIDLISNTTMTLKTKEKLISYLRVLA